MLVPKLITKDMLKDMKNGSVIVDVAIDQGGCIETSKAITHADPTYVVDGVVHYCVANKRWKKAMQENNKIKLGTNVIDGQITYKAVAEAFGFDYTPVEKFL